MSELFHNSYFILFLIISLGLLIGRIKIKGFSLDVSAVIFVALIFGHFGFVIPEDFQRIGLVLFIFSIGIQAGPGFFESFRKYGRQLILVSAVIVISGAVVTVLLGFLFNIDFKIAVGLFTGALTSTPGLAAAIESAQSPLASIGYGIAYPFGVIGVILFVSLLPKVININIKKAEEDYIEKACADFPEIHSRNFIVQNPNADGKSIGELEIATMTKAVISHVMHEGDSVAVTPKAKTKLHTGDLIRAVGTKSALDRIKILIGKPTDKEIQLSEEHDVQWVVVTNKEVANKRLNELQLSATHHATVIRLRRSGIEIIPNPQTRIHFGDRLLVGCHQENMAYVVNLLGNEVKRLSEADLMPISIGIVLGVLLGKLRFPLFGVLEFSLGITGGVLAAALILSKIGKTGPIIWTMSGSSNQLLRQLGLLLFLATVGTTAGGRLAETLSEYGFLLFFIGAVITIIPMLIGALVGHRFLKMNLLTLLGGITGGMTSTPGLGALDSMTDSNAPNVAYATVYPVAMVCVIILAQIIGKL